MPDHWVCLIYHDVRPDVPPDPGGRDYFSVPRDAFARQLDAIGRGGRAGLSLAETLARPDSPRVAISFDDGNLGQYLHAFPELRRRGMTATFFITTGWVGTPGYVTWDQLREMAAAGMSIQSHSHSHPYLSEADAAALAHELITSKALLDRELGQDTDSLALPGGDAPPARLRHLIEEAGYRVLATSVWGINHTGSDSMVTVRRCTVRGEPEAATFERVLAGDRWLGRRRRLRDGILAGLKRSLGRSRYARWRQRAFRLVGR